MADNEQQFGDDQWLSAYLDGELTSEQCAVVEQRLRDDPRAKQLLDELRDVSTALQTLPKEVVGDDLREKIYATAETRRENDFPHAGRARRWRWAALALAATLVMAVYLPEENRDEQPLAQAVPRQGEIAISAPKLEAPAGENKRDEIAAFKSIPTSDASSSMDVLAAGGQGGRKIEAEQHLHGVEEDFAVAGAAVENRPTDSASELAELPQLEDSTVGEVLQVHVALSDDQRGTEPFDRLLAANGIVFQEPESGFVDRQLAAPVGAVGGKLKNDSASELLEEESDDAELVLVEAPAEQIEVLLNACHDDPAQWKSLRLVGEGNSEVPLARWQSLQRGGAFRARSFGSADTPAERGMAAVLDSLSTDENSAPSLSKDQKKTAPRSSGEQLGWAVRVGRMSRVDSLRATEGERSSKIATLRSEFQRSKEQDKRKASDLEQGASIRVLFILHPGREKAKSAPSPVTKKKS